MSQLPEVEEAVMRLDHIPMHLSPDPGNRILLHICCAPCLSGSHELLDEEGVSADGLFFNPNVQPYQEHQKRLRTLESYISRRPMFVYVDPSYDIRSWMKDALAAGTERCGWCIRSRLERTADLAAEMGYSRFSTTLLLSKYQPHELIRKIGETVARDSGLEFFYRDLRQKWGRSIKISKKLGLYRQQYCGCIISEENRYLGADPSQ